MDEPNGDAGPAQSKNLSDPPSSAFFDAADEIGSKLTLDLGPNQRIGPFVLQRFLARGGMGQVWEAEDTQLRRRVALKLVLPDRVDPRSLELFSREARAGGRLSHPNLVTTLAHGTDEGLSWIAQELIEDARTVKGLLDELRSCDSVPEDHYRRVAELVSLVAAGLAAAHEVGVIHRDIKPQNILLTESGIPKVTDFGLARVSDESFVSQSGMVAGTYPYMSPEQIRPGESIDHRSDVFSLGVVLYELLTLRRPFEGDTSQQIASRILNSEPTTPHLVRSQCPLELSIIAGKALEKSPDRRYATMLDFCEDLRRHLKSEPIIARPPGPLTRLQKWAKRNAAVATSIAAAIAAFILITIFAVRVSVEQKRTTTALLRATQAEHTARRAALAEGYARSRESVERRAAEWGQREANRLARDMRAIADFQTQRLASLDPHLIGVGVRQDIIAAARSAGQLTKLEPEEIEERLESLDGLLRGIDFSGVAQNILEEHVLLPTESAVADIEESTETRVELWRSLASIYSSLGRFGRGWEVLQKAADDAAQLENPLRQDVLNIDVYRADMLHRMGRLADAETCARLVSERTLELLGADHVLSLTAAHALGNILSDRGRFDEAIPLLVDTRARMQRTLGETDAFVITATHSLASALSLVGRLREAERLHLDALQVEIAMYGDNSRAAHDTRDHLAQIYIDLLELDEADRHSKLALEGLRTLLGEAHPSTQIAYNTRALVLGRMGRVQEACEIHRYGLELAIDRHGENHPDTVASIINLGSTLFELGETDESESLLRKGLEQTRQHYGEDHPDTVNAMNHLAKVLATTGDFSTAEHLYRRGLELSGDSEGGGDVHLSTQRNLTDLLVLTDRPEEAIDVCRSAFRSADARWGPHRSDTMSTLQLLALLELRHGDEQEARKLLEEHLRRCRSVFGDNHETTSESASSLAWALAQGGDREASIPYFELALEASREALGSDHPQTMVRTIERAWISALSSEFAQAEQLALETLERIQRIGADVEYLRPDVADLLVELYDVWHSWEPDHGYDEKAAYWRSQLEDG